MGDPDPSFDRLTSRQTLYEAFERGRVAAFPSEWVAGFAGIRSAQPDRTPPVLPPQLDLLTCLELRAPEPAG